MAGNIPDDPETTPTHANFAPRDGSERSVEHSEPGPVVIILPHPKSQSEYTILKNCEFQPCFEHHSYHIFGSNLMLNNLL
jgi:hypothetical protein